jgi:hypothetical protein
MLEAPAARAAAGVERGRDAILTSLAQFDLLANLAAIDGSGSLDSSVFFTNWARFR